MSNNTNKLVNYMQRKTLGLPYTSNIAETNVESQINARFKRKQKRCSGIEKNAHNVLKLGALFIQMNGRNIQPLIDTKSTTLRLCKLQTYLLESVNLIIKCAIASFNF